jgi:hypothetical protein
MVHEIGVWMCIVITFLLSFGTNWYIVDEHKGMDNGELIFWIVISLIAFTGGLMALIG